MPFARPARAARARSSAPLSPSGIVRDPVTNAANAIDSACKARDLRPVGAVAGPAVIDRPAVECLLIAMAGS